MGGKVGKVALQSTGKRLQVIFRDPKATPVARKIDLMGGLCTAPCTEQALRNALERRNR